MPDLLKINDIRCGYDDNIVINSISFSLNKGEIGCLLGPSGCGKSTLLKAISGFHPLISGTISLGHEVISSSQFQKPAEKRKIGMVFQDYALFPHMTISENIRYGLQAFSASDKKSVLRDMLSLVNLTDLADRYPHELSGGQQQRVALARALAPKPNLILLDEPFSNLDAELRKKLSLDIRNILKQLEMTAILVTHDQSEAFAMCDRIGVIHQGRLMQWDTPYNLYHEPANRFVANFVGQGSFVSGKVLSPEVFDTELGVIQGNRAYPWDAGTPIDVLIRPDDIIFDQRSKQQAKINLKIFAGTSTLYRLELATGSHVDALVPSHQDYEVGDDIYFTVDAEHLIAFEKS